MSSTPHWAALERWSPTLFLAGGVVVVGYAALFAVEALTDATMTKKLASGTGFTLVFVGLLGLYPRLTDRSPKLARAAAVFAILGAVGFAIVLVTGAAQYAELDTPRWLSGFVVLNVLGILLGFSLSGIAVLRTGAHSRTVGLLLVVPAVVFVANIAAVVTLGQGNVSTWLGFVLTSAEALAILGVGYRLRVERVPAAADAPTAA